MPEKINSLKLNKKNKKIYMVINSTVFLILFLLSIFAIYRTIFPSQYFQYSFNNVNSLKNTITDVNLSEKLLTFYASTPLNFFQIKVNIKLEKASQDLENKTIAMQKSYKSLFYPLSAPIENLNSIQENILATIDNSVYIIGNDQKIPIDSPITFESLGYNWENVRPSEIDLSNYEKHKLADINSAHPTGTILKSSAGNDFYIIENFTRRQIVNPQISQIKNPVIINEKDLDKKEICTLEDSSIFDETSYECIVVISQINDNIGKDYRFSLEDLPADLKIKRINLEFKKATNKENIQFFLGNLRKNILYRFGFKDE